MMFGKMSKHQYVDNLLLSNMVELFVSNKAWMFAVSHMAVSPVKIPSPPFFPPPELSQDFTSKTIYKYTEVSHR
jgi:hypothetical protein